MSTSPDIRATFFDANSFYSIMTSEIDQNHGMSTITSKKIFSAKESINAIYDIFNDTSKYHFLYVGNTINHIIDLGNLNVLQDNKRVSKTTRNYFTVFSDVFKLNKSLETLNRIKLYQKNWDGYDTDNFQENHIRLVEDVLLAIDYEPSISPSSRNSIVIEHTIDHKKIIVEVFNDTFNYIIREKKDKKTILLQNNSNLQNRIEVLIDLMEGFYNGKYRNI